MFGLPLQSLATVLLWLAVIAFLLAGLVYLMRWLRGRDEDEPASSGDLLTSFRDIHSRGQLSDEEFRTIRSRLAAKVQGELNRPGDGYDQRQGGLAGNMPGELKQDEDRS